MKKLISLLTVLSMLLSSSAEATIINSLPYNLTNGSLADATQVMGNFNQIVSNANINAAHNGANNDITSLTGLTTPLSPTYGGTVLYTGGTTAGTANAQTLSTVTPSNFALTIGNIITAVAGATNSGATTLNIAAQGATAVRKANASGPVALVGGEIVSGDSYAFYYDGTYLIVLNPNLVTSTNFAQTAGTFDFSTTPAIPTGATATTQSAGNNSTAVATTAYADRAVKNALPNNITGFLPTSITASSNTSATITVTAGSASDSTQAVQIANAGTEAWSIANGNAANGYQGGTTLPNSSTIHFFECTGASGTVSFANNSTTPTCPTGYAVAYRRIFSVNTNSSGLLIPYVALEVMGGSIDCTLSTTLLDINTTFGTSRTAATLASIPTGVSMEVKYLASMTSGSGGSLRLTGLNEPDLAPSETVAGLADIAGNGAPDYSSRKLITNTSAQIGVRAAGAGVAFGLATLGWVDYRRN